MLTASPLDFNTTFCIFCTRFGNDRSWKRLCIFPASSKWARSNLQAPHRAASSSYRLCHVALVVMSVHNLLSREQPIISDTYISSCRDAMLFSIVSLGLPCLSSLPVFSLFATYSDFLLLITCIKMWIVLKKKKTSYSLKSSSLCLLFAHDSLIIVL